LGGFTLFTPTDEQLESGLYTKRYLLDQIAVALGGHVAEEIVYGEDEVTTGASEDLQKERRRPPYACEKGVRGEIMCRCVGWRCRGAGAHGSKDGLLAPPCAGAK
jgi:hypothetical protein